MSVYNESTRLCTLDDVTISQAAHTAVALYYLAAYLKFDPDSIGHRMDDAIDDCIPEGNINENLSDEILNEVARLYEGNPGRCLSMIAAVIAEHNEVPAWATNINSKPKFLS